MRYVLFLILTSVHGASSYDIAPVTDDMRRARDAIVTELLPQDLTMATSTAWQRLALITDHYGPRFSGTQALEEALSFIAKQAAADGLRVTEQAVNVPAWSRGEESFWLVSPRAKRLHAVGLGMSDGGNVTAPVFVVSSYNELHDGDNCTRATNTIVLFNEPWAGTYGATVDTRYYAGQWAQECSAVGALIRSVGPYSLQNPHTGSTAPAGIPAAALSLEDASQLQRMFDRGDAPVVSISMGARLLADAPSRNLWLDLVGSELPDEIVLLSGHGDSWDISEGAMDDGGGFITAWEAVRVLTALKLQPRRTIRAVVWTNEENGARGGAAYAADVNVNLTAHSFALEADEGAFSPYGIGVSCVQSADCSAAMAQLSLLGSDLLGALGSGNVSADGGGTDIDPMCKAGVVCAGVDVLDPRLTPGLNNPCTAGSGGAWALPGGWSADHPPYDSQYFFVHHSEADTMERLDPVQLNRVAASLAVWAYAIAALPDLLPRNASAPPAPAAGSGSGTSWVRVAGIAGGVAGGLLVLAAVVVVVRRRRSRFYRSPAPAYSTMASDYFRE